MKPQNPPLYNQSWKRSCTSGYCTDDSRPAATSTGLMVTDHFWPPPPFSLQMEMHGEAYSTVPSAVCQCRPSNYDRPVTPTAQGIGKAGEQRVQLCTTRLESLTTHVLEAFMLHTTRPARCTPHTLQAHFASHRLSCKPACFTPLILRPSHHTSWEPIWLHTTRLASHFTSHHLSCMLHTTQDTGLCDRQRDPKIAPVLRVRYPVPQTLCKLHPTQFESQSYY